MSNHINPSDYKIPMPSSAYFNDAHTMVLVSFFPRSGSSLLGYLLTAHRNMVIANEPTKEGENLYDQVPIAALLNHILYTDKMRYEVAEQAQLAEGTGKSLSDNSGGRAYSQKTRYVFIANQWQARCESLHVIGVKNSLFLAETLLTENVLQVLRAKLKKINLRLKFIFTVRNPYDMIATDVVYWANNKRLRTVTEGDINKMLDYKVRVSFPDMCAAAAELFELMKPQTIFLNKHEDLVADPSEQLSKLCEFLNVSAMPDYLRDCASVIRKKPNKSRHELEWSEEQKEAVEKVINKYNFFSGYGWDV